MTRRRTALAFMMLMGAVVALAQEAPPPEGEEVPAAESPPSTQAETPSFPAEIEQVVVDVVVTDKKGTPVRGLTRGDFTVLEDGVPQTVVSFDAVELPEEPAPGPRPGAEAEPTPPARVTLNTDLAQQKGRTFVIVFDNMHMVPWKANPAKAAVAAFLREAVREGDRVSLVSTSGDVWWSARMLGGRDKLIELVKRLEGRYIPEVSSDRISDWEALQIHEFRNPQAYARVLRRFQTYNAAFARRDRTVVDSELAEDPYIIQRASETYYKASVRLRTTLGTLERVLNGLVDVPGRKSVILVSEGFVYDPNRDWFKQVNEAARRANARIYFVDSKGLEGMPLTMTAEFGGAPAEQDMGMAIVDALDAVAGAEDVATTSGGFVVRDTNDLESGIQRIARETQAYYLLGYIPTNTARDGKFREIEVKLDSDKDRKIRARKGYYALTDTGETVFERAEGVDPVFQAALDSPWAQDEIPLRMTHYVGAEQTPGKAVVLVATEVDVRDFDLEEKDGRYHDTLEFLLVVAHLESGEFFRYDQSVVMNMLPDTKERVERFWLPIVRDFELREGDYQAKIVVRDARSGKVGTVTHEFRVPGLDSLRTSTPVLSDTLATQQPVTGAPGGRLEVIVRREFPVGSDLYCQIDVFGAETDSRSRMPRVAQGYVVRRADGAVFTGADPTEIRPTSLGSLSRVSGFSLTGAPPGDYEIVMSVRDELTGKALELREPFKVVPPADETPLASAAGQ
jgi:VWFA-related protein